MIIKNAKRKYFFIWLVGLITASLVLFVKISSDLRYARIDSVRKVRTGIIHAMYLNNHISSIISMYSSNKEKILCNNAPSGGVFYFTDGDNACYIKKALWFVEKNINKNILANRYVSFPGKGMIFFFDKNEYSGLDYNQYSDAITMTGRFSVDGLHVNSGDNPLSYRAAISGFNEIYIDKVTGEPVLTLVAPVIDYSTNKTAGALFQDVTLSRLIKTARNVNFPSWVNIALSSSKEPGFKLCLLRKCNFSQLGFYRENYADELEILFGIDWLTMLLSYKMLFLSWGGYAIILYAICVKCSRFELKFKLESYTDSLTKVFNRKVLNEMDIKKFKSFVIFDCNDFKKINDVYGHLAGDAALVYIAECMNDALRKDDVLIRYGGDEFIVLCKDNDAEVIANKIKTEVESKPLKYKNTVIPLAVSYGVAEVRDSFMSTLFDADKRLYTNKISSHKTAMALNH